jgi:hypothetical protein
MVLEVRCIVEGQGDMAAVPLLIRRIAVRVDPALTVRLPQPLRVPRQLVVQPGELERALHTACRSIRKPMAVLVVVDSDTDCPAQLGPDLLRRAVQARSDIPIAVVLAKREYEAWFLAAAESVRGHCKLPPTLQPPADPEAISDAKGWLRRHMPRSRKYDERHDQPALTAVFDLDLARSRSDSFDKCYREIERLLRLLQQATSTPTHNSGTP